MAALAMGVRWDECLWEGLKLQRVIALRTAPGHNLTSVPNPPHLFCAIKHTGCIPCPVAHHHLIRRGEWQGERGQEETLILWNAKCLASSASCSLLFGVTKQEGQNKAVKVQN